MQVKLVPGPGASGLLLLLALVPAACSGPSRLDDPLAVLQQPDATSRARRMAMNQLEAGNAGPAYGAALASLLVREDATSASRIEAFDRLVNLDPGLLRATLSDHLPLIEASNVLEAYCEGIGDHGWTDLTPALVSSWARQTASGPGGADRPEFEALARLHGAARVRGIVLEVFLTPMSTSRDRQRIHCWALLCRLGEEALLREILDGEVDPDDALLADLQAGWQQLGVFPMNTEEVLWILWLRMETRAEWWQEARLAVSRLPGAGAVEARDLPLAVAAARHDPAMLDVDARNMALRVRALLEQSRTIPRREIPGRIIAGPLPPERALHFDWGDRAAVVLACRAVRTPGVAATLFALADEDRRDRTTEHGGVITQDTEGTFRVVPYAPARRDHDRMFTISTAMLEASYTGLFHYHFHAQQYVNDAYAGPGRGDLAYADLLRANCLVVTFINSRTLNIDLYRHGGHIVDLGVIER